MWNDLDFKGTEANLSRSSLTSVPQIVSQLTWLKILDLSYNKLVSLPRELNLLVNLTTLIACRNLLTSIPPLMMPLQFLDLSFNQLERVPKLSPTLGYLDLYENKLEKRMFQTCVIYKPST